MATIPIAYILNILETGTVTVSGEASGKPKERLFDRDLGVFWEDASAAGTRTIQVDQGATVQSIDTWLIAAGHNLSAATVNLDSSPDASVWTNRDTLVPSGTALIRRTIPSGPFTIRYWRVTISNASAAPQIAELLLTLARTFPDIPISGVIIGRRGNVLVSESRAGRERATRRGAARWQTEYDFGLLTLTQRSAIETADADTQEGTKFFYLVDAENIVRWVRWLDTEVLEFVGLAPALYTVTTRFRAVL